MKAQILKIAGVVEAAFYKKYPTEEAFFNAHPEAQMMQRELPEAQLGGVMGLINGSLVRDAQHQITSKAKELGPMLMQLAPLLMNKGGSTYSGGVWFEDGGMPMMQVAGQTPGYSDDSWISKMFNYEATHGSATGSGLSNFGYNNPRGYKEDPVTHLYTNSEGKLYNGTGRYTAPKSMQEAIDQYKKEYLPSVSNYAPGVRERMGDFLFNSGEDARLYQLDQYIRKYENKADGLEFRGNYRAGRALNSSFNDKYKEYEAKIAALPMAEQIKLLDDGRDYYYQNINRKNDQPSAAYTATWKPRLGVFGEYKAPEAVQPAAVKAAQGTQPVAAPVAQPAVQAAQPVAKPAAVVAQPVPVAKPAAVAQATAPVTQPAPSMIQPAPQQAAAPLPQFNYNTGILNQNQNVSGLNNPFTVAGQALQPIPAPKLQAKAATQAPVASTASQVNTAVATPASAAAGAFNWQQPLPSQNVPLPRQTIINADGTKTEKGNFGEAVTLFQTDPKQTVGAPTVPLTDNKPAGQQQGQSKDRWIAAQDKLATEAADPYSFQNIAGYAASFVEGINNQKAYKEGLERRRFDYSTDGMYNPNETSAMNRGQYDMYGTMAPANQSGMMSFTGMNQKYSYAEGGESPYETSGLSWIPQDLGPVAQPFINMAPPPTADVAATNTSGAINSADIGSLPLDADAMLATIGSQESSSKKGEAALGLKTKLVGPDGKHGSASGTFQITNNTLEGIYGKHFKGQYDSFGKFKSAFDTNKDVEYSAAKALMNDHIKQYGIYALGAWYQPSFAAKAAKGDMSVMNTIPAPEYGNKVTFGDYFNKSLKNYRKALGLPAAPSSGQIATKAGVNISSLQPNLMSFAETMSSNFPGIKISSGNDSTKHMKGSRHYENKAIDIGANSSDPGAYSQLKKFLTANPAVKQQYGIEDIIDEGDHIHVELYRDGGEMIKRADGSYSKRGLWDNIRANKGSGKKPTREMLEQERKIRSQEMALGGEMELTADQINYIRAMGGDVEFL